VHTEPKTGLEVFNSWLVCPSKARKAEPELSERRYQQFDKQKSAESLIVDCGIALSEVCFQTGMFLFCLNLNALGRKLGPLLLDCITVEEEVDCR
jgi:hypothetical protein